MQLRRAMLVIKPQGPRHSRNRCDQTPVNGNHVEFLGQTGGPPWGILSHGALGQFFDDLFEQFWIEYPR